MCAAAGDNHNLTATRPRPSSDLLDEWPYDTVGMAPTRSCRARSTNMVVCTVPGTGPRRCFSTVSYTLDVGGDIRSSGVMRVDTIRPQTYGAFGTPLPYNSLTLSASVTASGDIIASGTVSATSFVGDGTSLTGIATIGNVVANSATASFLTNASAIDGGSF